MRAGFSAGAKMPSGQEYDTGELHAAVLFHLIAPIITPRRFQRTFASSLLLKLLSASKKNVPRRAAHSYWKEANHQH